MEDFSDAVAAVQEGDYEALKSLVLARIFGPNTLDANCCTLLHWAAINNRVQIASLLIDHGAESLPGGILNETPLQWALRKRYYAMAELLVEKLHPDLAHRSRDGLDALHLACRLDDPNAVFLLLSWGAPVDSVDNDGNTALLWLAKSDDFTANRMEILRLLLRFGANASLADYDGNTAVHLLAKHRKLDLTVAFLLYQSAGASIANATNRAGNTPYAEAVTAENRRLTRFLFDMLFFNYLPYWTPGILSALLVITGFLLVQYDGYFYGGIYFVALWTFLSYTLFQQHVYDHRCRTVIGVFAGLILSFVAIYHIYLAPFLSAFMQFLQVSIFLACCLLGYRFCTTKPRQPTVESRTSMLSKIVRSSCSEGTEEENEIAGDFRSDNGTTTQKLMKDAFTGKFVMVNESGGESLKPPQKRTMAPRLCGACLCDKRCIEFRSSADSGATSIPTISLATHCPYCHCCVVDQDHHCEFLGNCVGHGNRSTFVFLAACSALCYLFFLCNLKYVQYALFCETDASRSWVFAKEACLFKTFPSLFITQLLVIFFGSAAVCLGYNEVLFVARETTLTNVMKMRYVAKPPPPAKQQANVITFLRTGQFRVTYPKVEDDVSQRQRKKQCRHHDDEGHDHSHDHVHDSQDRPEASLDQPDQTVRNLLAQIESDMGIRPRATSQQQQGMENERTERGRSMSVKIVPTSTPSRRPSNASVIYSNDIESAPEYSHHRDGGVERHGAEEGQEDMEGDADDDYDMEFVNSEANLYDRFYWQETDAPLEAEAQSLLRSA